MDKVTKWKKEIDELKEKQIKQNKHVNKFLQAMDSQYEQLGDFLTETLEKLKEEK